MAEDPPSTLDNPNRLRAKRPTRGADRNQQLTSNSDPRDVDCVLPSLEDGITLLDITGCRGVEVLQALVLNHLLLHDGPAFWVDANSYATTTSIARLTPSQRLLDRVHVARGFTAYQHYGAICDLSEAVNRSIRQTTTGADDQRDPPRDESSYLPSLIVAPAIDVQYRDEETLTRSQADTLQARTLARIVTYADRYEIPVLVTRTTTDAFTAPIATAADHLLTHAREHADSSGLLNHRNPLLPALISIDLEQEARLDGHDARLEELERKLDEIVTDGGHHSSAEIISDGVNSERSSRPLAASRNPSEKPDRQKQQ